MGSKKGGTNGAEFYGKIVYLKASLAFSNHITTGSHTYACEIQETDQGCSLQDFLKTKSHKITGILNGIDHIVWDQKTDKALSYIYIIDTLMARTKNKADLLKSFDLSEDTAKPLFAVISRLGHQNKWVALQKRGMQLDFGWSGPAQDYKNLYTPLPAAN